MSKYLTIDTSTGAMSAIDGTAGPAGPTLSHPLPMQSVVSAANDIYGNPTYLQINGTTPLNMDLKATATHVVLSIPNGFDSFGNAVDNMPVISADIASAWSFPASSTSYPYIKRDPSTGNLSYSYSTTPCIFSKGVPKDPQTVSLLHFNVDLTDEAMKIWTSVNSAAVSATQSKFGGKSLFLNGTNQYISTPATTDLNLPGDFTVEWWEYRTSGTSVAFCGGFGAPADASYLIGYYNSGAIKLYLSSNGTSFDIANGVTMGTAILNTWTHYAVARQGNNFYTFQNGIQQATFSSSSVIIAQNYPNVIGYSTGGTYFAGYIDEFRVSKVARYTSNFTPATTEFDGVTGQIWFDYQNRVLKIYDGTNWNPEQRLYVADVVTGVSAITTITPYAIQGRYESMFATTVTTINKAHNLGCPGIFTLEENGVQSAKNITNDRLNASWTGVAGTTTLYAKRVFD